MEQLVSLPPETNEFEANGVVYTFEEALSIERFQAFQRFRMEAGFGLTFEGFTNVLRQNIDYLERFAQGQKVYSEMVNVNYNALKGAVDMVSKEPYSVWMCTLFFNAPGEDRRLFSADVMREKIKDWVEAGIDNAFFTQRSLALILNFSEAYKAITQMSLGWLPGENPQSEVDRTYNPETPQL